MVKMFNLNSQEIKLFKKLNTPRKVQDFIETLRINFETNGHTFMSPRMVLKKKAAHCVEGAMLAAAILRFHGRKPFILDLKTTADDEYHVIAPFQKNGCWGAISKTNHAVLRYRDPIYRNIRELVLSFFHEYHKNGRKTLRSYTNPVDLSRFDKINWMTTEDDLWAIDDYLDKVRHIPIFPKNMANYLRKADKIEIRAGELTQWKK